MSRIGQIVVFGALLLATGCASTEAGTGSPDASVTGASTSTPAESSTPAETASPSETSTSDSPSTSTSDSGGSEDAEAIAQVTEDFYHALGKQDGDAACATLSVSMKAAVASGAADCPSAVRTRSGNISAAERDRITRLEVDPSRVEVTGSTAEVPTTAMTVPGAATNEQGSVQLIVENGDWVINGLRD